MKKLLSLCLCTVLLCACGGAKYNVRGDKVSTLVDDSRTIVIVKNEAAKEGFLTVMRQWFATHAYKTVVATSAPDDLSQPYITYTARWSWDLGIFLADATVQAFSDGRPAASSTLRVPNNFNLNKYGGTEERIANLLSLLFYHQPSAGQKPRVTFEIE